MAFLGNQVLINNLIINSFSTAKLQFSRWGFALSATADSRWGVAPLLWITLPYPPHKKGIITPYDI
ncbi:MAG: hypothetical protein COU71_01875 [Parcubacteria group bacterium CG10_big_fil_rev_8_21_14_0_10_38_31]|nr:MAG: hypothetical protein COU71_01875 [Parcubacteria group bacterium CG10_big_fil_rev_8_21_14_0_10_38_31]